MAAADPSANPSHAPKLAFDRIARGDTLGALAATKDLLEGFHVPVRLRSEVISEKSYVARAELRLLSCIDDVSPLRRVFADSGLPTVVALRAFCQLWERKVVALR